MSLSMDLRKRLIEAYEKKEGSIRGIASRFKVNASTVWRLLKRKRSSGGSLAPGRPSGRPSKFDAEGLVFLEECLSNDESLTLKALSQRYEAHRGISVSLMAVYRACKRLKFRYKKNVLSERATKALCSGATQSVPASDRGGGS